MGARAELRRDVLVASEAGCRRRPGRVPGLGRTRVAVHTLKVLVNAVSQGVGPYCDGFTPRIHQSCAGPVTRNTVIRSVERGSPGQEN